MRVLVIIWLAFMASACVLHRGRVPCEGRLQPINVHPSSGIERSDPLMPGEAKEPRR